MPTKARKVQKGRPGGHKPILEDADKTERIVKMREQGKTWSEIGEKLKMTPGRAQFLLLVSQVKPSERIKFDGDDDLGKKIVAARDRDKLAWPLIAARTGVTEGRVKDIYRRVKDGKPAAGERGKRTDRKATKRTPAKAKAKARAKTKGTAKRTAKRKRSRSVDPSTSR